MPGPGRKVIRPAAGSCAASAVWVWATSLQRSSTSTTGDRCAGLEELVVMRKGRGLEVSEGARSRRRGCLGRNGAGTGLGSSGSGGPLAGPVLSPGSSA